MTNPDYTALLFIIDQSGSMYNIAGDMEGGISELLKEQGEIEGKVSVDFAYFDDKFEYEDRLLPLTAAAPKITPRGMTALYDAIARATSEFGASLEAMPEDERPGKVLTVIVTDGLENCSKENTVEDVKSIITKQREEFNWEFVFLGANQDAVMTGKSFGIPSGSSLTYDASSAGVNAASVSLRSYTKSFRSGETATFVN